MLKKPQPQLASAFFLDGVFHRAGYKGDALGDSALDGLYSLGVHGLDGEFLGISMAWTIPEFDIKLVLPLFLKIAYESS